MIRAKKGAAQHGTSPKTTLLDAPGRVLATLKPAEALRAKGSVGETSTRPRCAGRIVLSTVAGVFCAVASHAFTPVQLSCLDGDVLSTSFLASTEGRDPALAWVRGRLRNGWVAVTSDSNRGFVYDNSLAILALLQANERGDLTALNDARKILDFLRRTRQVDRFGNVFWRDSINQDGAPVPGASVSSGNQSWVAYAIARYQRITGDDQYLDLARGTAGWLSRSVTQGGVFDRDGGIRGGFEVRGGRDVARLWTSTEHNLIAYFAFKELLRVDTDPPDQLDYGRVEGRIARWLLADGRGWNAGEKRFNRGERDGTLALDAQTGGIIFLLDRHDVKKALYVSRALLGRLITRVSFDGAGVRQTYTGVEFEQGDGSLWWEGAAQAAHALERLARRFIDIGWVLKEDKPSEWLDESEWDGLSGSRPAYGSQFIRLGLAYRTFSYHLITSLLRSDEIGVPGLDNDGNGGYQYALQKGTSPLGTKEQPTPGLWLHFALGEAKQDQVPLYPEPD